MSEQLFEAFEVCLQLMDENVSIEQCLARFPNLADELRPALEGAYSAKSLGQTSVPLEAMNRSRTRLLGLAAQMRKDNMPRRSWMGLSRLAFSLLVLAVLLVMTSGGLFAASAKSLPGDTLYPVKRAVANLRVNLATGADHKSEAKIDIRNQRLAEVRQLLAMQLVRDISFEGVVEKISAEQWIVSDIQVHVDDNTIISGSIVEGMLVKIDGTTDLLGYVSAHNIQLEEFQMTGRVENIGRQEWMISGMAVKITSETQIGIGIGVGDFVLVLVQSEDDDTLTAKAILKLGEGTATSTPLPTMTQIPESATQPSQELNSTEADNAGDDAQNPDDNVGDTQESETPESEDNGGEEESTPQPEGNGDEGSGSDDGNATPEPEETNDNHSGSGGGGEDPTEIPEATPEPEQTDEEQSGSGGGDNGTEEPEETPEAETTP